MKSAFLQHLIIDSICITILLIWGDWLIRVLFLKYDPIPSLMLVFFSFLNYGMFGDLEFQPYGLLVFFLIEKELLS